MLPLLAQATESSIAMSIIQALANNGLWVFLGICVLAGTAKHIVQLVLRHQERIAMIEAGMEPDQAPTVYPKGFRERTDEQAC